MGKRELVLIVAFVLAGAAVYQLTAPPPPPGSEDVSVGGIFQKLKREMQGPRETATADSKQSFPVDASIRLIRLSFARANDLTVVGADTADISVESHVTARGFSQAEAKAAADAAQVKIERTADAVAMTSAWPVRRDGPRSGFISQGTIIITVPKRLLIRLEPHIGQLIVRGVAGLEVMSSRGETRMSGIAGAVAMTHAGGRLEIENVGSLKLTGRNSEGSIAHVSGTASLTFTGGEMRLADLTGPVEIETRNTDLTLDASKMAKPPFRFNGEGGQLRVEHLRTEARIDGRRVDLDVDIAAAAPITIYSTGETMLVTPPPGGYTLDAVATEGQLAMEDGTMKPAGDGEQRLSGPVRGGGPALTLRGSRGDIRVRKPAAGK